MGQFNYKITSIPALPRSAIRRARHLSASSSISTLYGGNGGAGDGTKYVKWDDVLKTTDTVAKEYLNTNVMSSLLIKTLIDNHDHAGKLIRPAALVLPNQTPSAAGLSLNEGEHALSWNHNGSFSEQGGGGVSEIYDLTIKRNGVDLNPNNKNLGIGAIMVDISVPTISFGTAGTDYVPLSVDGLAKNLLTAHQSVVLTGGTNNGTLKLTVNGSSTDNISVTGLGAAAYRGVATTMGAGMSALVPGSLLYNVLGDSYNASYSVKDFVNSSIQTATAEYKGSYNLVSDLSLAVSATHSQIASALASAVSGADNNDYCFVEIPTNAGTLTEISKIERYKYNGTSWSYEYALNNSGFTAAQWSAINSGITSSLVTSFGAKYDKPSGGIPLSDLCSAVQTSLNKADTSLQPGITLDDIDDGSSRKLANYLPLSGGELKSNGYDPLTLNSASVATVLNFKCQDTITASIKVNKGVANGLIIGYKTDTLNFVGGNLKLNNNYTFLHSNNYSSYALPLTGGTMSGNITMGKHSVIYNDTADSSWNLSARNAGIQILNAISTVPTGASSSYAVALSVSGYYGFQISSTGDEGSTNFKMRNVANGIVAKYSDWVTLLHSDNYSSYALPLAGGTLTGTLNAQNILPSATNTYTLGDSTHRWLNLYAGSIDANGNITLGTGVNGREIGVNYSAQYPNKYNRIVFGYGADGLKFYATGFASGDTYDSFAFYTKGSPEQLAMIIKSSGKPVSWSTSTYYTTNYAVVLSWTGSKVVSNTPGKAYDYTIYIRATITGTVANGEVLTVPVYKYPISLGGQPEWILQYTFTSGGIYSSRIVTLPAITYSTTPQEEQEANMLGGMAEESEVTTSTVDGLTSVDATSASWLNSDVPISNN